MNEIYAAEKEFILNYVNKRENATEAQYKMASDLFTELFGEREIMSISGDTATINITGPLSRNGPDLLDMLFGFGGTGYNEIIDAISEAEQDGNVKKINFLINSPGGRVTGVDDVWQAIKKCSKQTMAINDGLIASAAFYIASAADTRKAKTPISETGSIGVLIVATDYNKAMEAAGIKEHYIVSKNAPNKVADVATDEGMAILQKEVNDIESVFYDRISEGMGVTSEKIAKDFGQGGVMIAKDAIAAGMLDGYMYEDSAATVAENNTPDSGGMEGTMNLDEFLAQNPDAKAAHKAMLTAARAEGVALGESNVQARIDAVVPYLGKEEYKGMEKLCSKVLSGETATAALEGAVTAFDMISAQKGSYAAQEETEATAETNCEQHAVNTSGMINSLDDIMAVTQGGA